MRALILTLVCACSDGSGFTGSYETVSAARGACNAALVDEAVSPQDRLFRLDDVDSLVAYYACTEGGCDELYDLARSFGRAKDAGWAGYVSSAIPSMGCILTHRVRRLAEAPGGVTIETAVYRETDGTLMGPACDQAVAAERGTTMPCVETSLLTAEDR